MRLFRRRHPANAEGAQTDHPHPRGGALRHPFHAAWRYRSIADEGEGRSFYLDVLIPGGVAGTVGGALMALVYMSLSAAFGNGFWTLPKMIGAVIYPYAHTADLGIGSLLFGFVVHFAVAGALGTTFALMLPRRGTTMFAVVPLGIFYALIMYVVMNAFVVDVVDPTMRRELMHPVWWVSHLAYGAVLSMIQPMRLGRAAFLEGRPTFWQREARA
ncbi:MAG: hypothetical protein IRZ16_12795 [Myxococcaceae bacterium]|nr:hypothetical protein [Myxococcaceae bacterium]